MACCFPFPAGAVTISLSSTMFRCRSDSRMLISRSDVIGNPHAVCAESSLIFLSATCTPLTRSSARWTTPYDPSSMVFKRLYADTPRQPNSDGSWAAAAAAAGEAPVATAAAAWARAEAPTAEPREGDPGGCVRACTFRCVRAPDAVDALSSSESESDSYACRLRLSSARRCWCW